jgi:hypothetical protein
MFLNAQSVPAAKRRRRRRAISVMWFMLATFLLFVAFFDMVTLR